MPDAITMILSIGTPIAAIALSYGGIRSMVKSLQKDFSALSEKVTALENSKAGAAQVTNIEDNLSTAIRQMDVKVTANETIRVQHDVALATLKTSHEELQRKHNDASAEIRSRTSALEGRTSTIEQGAVELRAQMNAVVQAVARVEAKQDREAQALEQIRRDLLEFVVNPKRRSGQRGQ